METILVPTKGILTDYTGRITEVCDENRIARSKISQYLKTYVVDTVIDDKRYLLIRYPGSTVGRIDIDENSIIKNIIIYDDMIEGNNFAIYNKNIITVLQQFIGCKLIIR